jgi:hypothetical protein
MGREQRRVFVCSEHLQRTEWMFIAKHRAPSGRGDDQLLRDVSLSPSDRSECEFDAEVCWLLSWEKPLSITSISKRYGFFGDARYHVGIT